MRYTRSLLGARIFGTISRACLYFDADWRCPDCSSRHITAVPHRLWDRLLHCGREQGDVGASRQGISEVLAKVDSVQVLLRYRDLLKIIYSVQSSGFFIIFTGVFN